MEKDDRERMKHDMERANTAGNQMGELLINPAIKRGEYYAAYAIFG